jgi:predicted molibdopterin-dependent oxidoreductase YjgC
MCDDGRYGFGWIDQGRLTKVRDHGVESTWEQATSAIAAQLADMRRKKTGAQIGVIASSQLTNEELFLIREIFHNNIGAYVTASVPAQPGYSDDFLIKADKSPNARGAALLGLTDTPDAAAIVEAALQDRIQVLWVFGHDLAKLFGSDTLERLSRTLRLFIFSGTTESDAASSAHWVLPAAAYVEKDGTFVNCHGRVQRIGRAFPPLPDSRADWSVLLEIARQLSLALPWRNPQEIFVGLAERVTPFSGLTYEKLGSRGVALPLGTPAEQTAAL